MILVGIMKQQKKWVGIFKNMDGIIPGGSFLGGIFPGGNLPWGSLICGDFPGWNFHDNGKKICQKFSSVHALTLTFIGKTFILQTHSLRV